MSGVWTKGISQRAQPFSCKTVNSLIVRKFEVEILSSPTEMNKNFSVWSWDIVLTTTVSFIYNFLDSNLGSFSKRLTNRKNCQGLLRLNLQSRPHKFNLRFEGVREAFEFVLELFKIECLNGVFEEGSADEFRDSLFLLNELLNLLFYDCFGQTGSYA